MNRLLFNEGGQPIYLDDLKQIQDNGLNMNGALLNALTGNGGAYLITPYTYETGAGGNSITVNANAIVYNGEILPFEEETFTNDEISEAGHPVLVCVRDGTSDARTFKDGTEHNCRMGYTAYLSLDTTGAVDYFNITGMDNLMGLMAERLFPKEEIVMNVQSIINNSSVSISCFKRFDMLEIHLNIEYNPGTNSESTRIQIATYNAGSPKIHYSCTPMTYQGGASFYVEISTNGIYLINATSNGIPPSINISTIFYVHKSRLTS